jgi:hypothetical protein
MGSTGAYLKEGGFKEYCWKETGNMYGVKILEKKTKGKEKQSLPPFSNTPGTAYVLLDSGGKFKQFCQYGENRRLEFIIDYGPHGGAESLHVHWYKNGNRQGDPEIIASKEGGVVNRALYNKYKKFLKGVGL